MRRANEMANSGKQTLKCFLLFVPFFVLAVISGGIYNDLRTNDIPDTVPGPKMTKAGQGITAAMSNLGLLWNFFEFIPSLRISSAGGFLFVSCVEFIIGGLLLLAVGLQSTYLPHTLSGCNGAYSWGVQGNTTNLFRFVGQLDQNAPQDVCKSYMTTWIMGIVLGTCTMISSYSAMKEARNPPSGHGKDFVGWLIDLVPRFLSTPIKYTMLWLRKWGRRRSTPGLPRKISTASTASTEIVTLKPYIRPLERSPTLGSQSNSNEKFMEILSSYPIMTTIARNLHYADLVQLSLASKDVHDVIFPGSKPAASSSLKKHWCFRNKSGTCWCCKNQICSLRKNRRILGGDTNNGDCNKVCATSVLLPRADTTGHLHHCTQYCSKCFRTRLCRPSGPRELSRKCICNINRGTSLQSLCRFCLELPDGVAKERVEKRELDRMLAKAAKQVNCGGCGKRLPKTGPRWWACGRCKKECRSAFHPQWAGKAEA